MAKGRKYPNIGKYDGNSTLFKSLGINLIFFLPIFENLFIGVKLFKTYVHVL